MVFRTWEEQLFAGVSFGDITKQVVEPDAEAIDSIKLN